MPGSHQRLGNVATGGAQTGDCTAVAVDVDRQDVDLGADQQALQCLACRIAPRLRTLGSVDPEDPDLEKPAVVNHLQRVAIQDTGHLDRRRQGWLRDPHQQDQQHQDRVAVHVRSRGPVDCRTS